LTKTKAVVRKREGYQRSDLRRISEVRGVLINRQHITTAITNRTANAIFRYKLTKVLKNKNNWLKKLQGSNCYVNLMLMTWILSKQALE
jgi:hypothetical protein